MVVIVVLFSYMLPGVIHERDDKKNERPLFCCAKRNHQAPEIEPSETLLEGFMSKRRRVLFLGYGTCLQQHTFTWYNNTDSVTLPPLGGISSRPGNVHSLQ